jgi:hypothetical protein
LKPAARKAARAAANTAALAAGEQCDAALFEALRQRRPELAEEQAVAAYVVFAGGGEANKPVSACCTAFRAMLAKPRFLRGARGTPRSPNFPVPL